MTRPLAVLDIDGVVADATHRLHHLAGQPTHAEWVRFFADAGDDPLLAPGADLARRLASEHEIAWVTGRPERTRSLTEQWLARHELPIGELLMYPEPERRPARVVKLEHVRCLARRHHIVLAVDDDPRVIELYKGAGITVELATWLPWSLWSPTMKP